MNQLKIENHMKSRSLPAITATAFRLLSQNLKLWTRRLWIWILSASAALGVSYASFIQIPAEHDPMRTLALWATGMAASLLVLVLMAFLVGNVMAVLKGQKARPNIIRALKLTALMAVIYAASVAIYYAISIPLVLVWHVSALYLHVLLALAWSLLLVLILIPIIYSGMRYLADDSERLRHVLGRNYITGLRHYWRLLLMLVVCDLIAMLITTILAAPANIITLAYLQDALGVYLGDPDGMPAWAPLLAGLAAALAALAYYFVWLWQFFCTYYQYGSITTRMTEYEKVTND